MDEILGIAAGPTTRSRVQELRARLCGEDALARARGALRQGQSRTTVNLTLAAGRSAIAVSQDRLAVLLPVAEDDGLETDWPRYLSV